MQRQFDLRSAILALALVFTGSDMLHARPEIDPCGRSYPQLTATCDTAGLTLAVGSTEATKAIQLVASPAPVQPASDLVRIRNNRGRE